MDKVFVIKQFLRDSGVKFRDYKDAIIIIDERDPEQNFDIYISFFRPVYGRVPDRAAEDEVFVEIEIIYPTEEEKEGATDHRAYAKVSLADPDCFFKIGEAIRNGKDAPLKWKIHRIKLPPW